MPGTLNTTSKCPQKVRPGKRLHQHMLTRQVLVPIVAGHEQHRQITLIRAQPLRQGKPFHARQGDVGEEKIQFIR